MAGCPPWEAKGATMRGKAREERGRAVSRRIRERGGSSGPGLRSGCQGKGRGRGGCARGWRIFSVPFPCWWGSVPQNSHGENKRNSTRGRIKHRRERHTGKQMTQTKRILNKATNDNEQKQNERDNFIPHWQFTTYFIHPFLLKTKCIRNDWHEKQSGRHGDKDGRRPKR